ncbi:hypothetical protein KUL152_25340 [Tenacibaculum sp. KUL152]|nr:hypothetical protein KUL152_25340 [Tenacibaculum sp. KUL152]
MKKLLLTTTMAAGLALSGQAAATPFYLDLTDDSTVNPRGAIDALGLQYDSVSEVNTLTGQITSRGGLGLIGYTFNGSNAGFTDLADLVLSDDGAIQNTFTYDPVPNNLGVDIGAAPTIVVTALTFDFELDGFLNPGGDSVTYTGGVLDIYSYQYSYNFFDPDNITVVANSEDLLVESEFSTSSINLGEQVIESLITEVSLTPAGQEIFYFEGNSGFVSFQDYIDATLTDILLYASQTVTVGELANSIANPIDVDGDTVLISDNHAVTVEFRVPEPSTVAVLGLGLISMFGFSRRSKK